MRSAGERQVIRGLLATLADHLVANLLPLIQRAETGPLHRRDVNEHILAAVIGLDETEALLRIEPLDDTYSHIGLLSAHDHAARSDAQRRSIGLMGS